MKLLKPIVQNGEWGCASCKGAYKAGEAAGRAEAEAELKPVVKKTRCDYCSGLFNMKNMARHVQESCKEAIKVEGAVKIFNCSTCQHSSRVKDAFNKHDCLQVIAKRKKAEEKAATAEEDAAEEAAAMAEVEVVAATIV